MKHAVTGGVPTMSATAPMYRHYPKGWRQLLAALAAALSCATAFQASAQPQPTPVRFSFGLITQATDGADAGQLLRDALARTDADNLAFVVVHGIKAAAEPCTDKLFEERRDQYEAAKNGLILSLAGSDWAECRNANGRPVSLERLRRVRDLFFTDDMSFGASKIPVIRQASTPKFYSYVENTRWEFGDILFATVNVPANNNQYSLEAGRNGEFEDRLIANRDWLKRLFVIAGSRRFAAVVIFSDGSLAPNGAENANRNVRRDGFIEMRKSVATLAAKYPCKVLLVQGAPANSGTGSALADATGIASGSVPGNTGSELRRAGSSEGKKEDKPIEKRDGRRAGIVAQPGVEKIVWHGNIGTVRSAPGVARLVVDHAAPGLITVTGPAAPAKQVR